MSTDPKQELAPSAPSAAEGKQLAAAVRTVGIIGAGLMGSGIAMCFLRAGYNVVLVETKQARAVPRTALAVRTILTPCSTPLSTDHDTTDH